MHPVFQTFQADGCSEMTQDTKTVTPSVVVVSLLSHAVSLHKLGHSGQLAEPA